MEYRPSSPYKCSKAHLSNVAICVCEKGLSSNFCLLSVFILAFGPAFDRGSGDLAGLFRLFCCFVLKELGLLFYEGEIYHFFKYLREGV